jgi:hypothetical protein
LDQLGLARQFRSPIGSQQGSIPLSSLQRHPLSHPLPNTLTLRRLAWNRAHRLRRPGAVKMSPKYESNFSWLPVRICRFTVRLQARQLVFASFWKPTAHKYPAHYIIPSERRRAQPRRMETSNADRCPVHGSPSRKGATFRMR